MVVFDREYLVDAAKGLWHYLQRGNACEIAYTPGNGSLYELVLVPAGMSQAQHWMDHARARSITADRPELANDDRWLVVAWVGHGCWPVDLGAVWSRGYFAEKFGCSEADGEALRALLLEVADVAGMRRLQVAS